MASAGWQVPTSYDRLKDESAAARISDPTFGVRKLNGFGKELLFRCAFDLLCGNAERRPPLRIVDLACGRGGDVGRISRAYGEGVPVLYTGMDLSANQIQAARERTAKGGMRAPEGSKFVWMVGDAFAPRVLDDIKRKDFDVVSIQMALHYAAASEERMAAAIDNIAGLCRPGGVVVLTTTDWKPLLSFATLEADETSAVDDICQVGGGGHSVP